MKQRIVVVGGLAAGPSAAAKAKRVNPGAEVILLEKGEHISYGICEIPYFISQQIESIDELIHFTPSSLQTKKGVEVRVNSLAEEIVSTKKTLIVRNLQKNKQEGLKYDKLILCTGSKSVRLMLPGEEGRNVFRVKSLDDAIGLNKYIVEEKPRKGVIVGGGYVGMEMAEALRSRGLEVTILHKDELPLNGLEENTRKAILAELVRNGVKFIPKSGIRQLNSDGSGKIVGVMASTGLFDADFVILSLGVVPNADLALTAKIRLGRHGGIVTDTRQCTNIGSIYAAGDCCEVKNLVNNKLMYLPLATLAARQGRIAGENAAGGGAYFGGAIRSMAVKIFDLQVAHVGLSAKEAEESGFTIFTEEIVGPSKIRGFERYSDIHIIAICDKKSGRILGANLYGNDGVVARANLLAVAIQRKISVKEIYQLDLIYTPPFAPLWDPILTLSSRIQKRLTTH